MALFTESQANACIIKSIDKVVKGSKVSWIIRVHDTDGNVYDMKLTSLGADPSKSDIKTAAIAEILIMDKRPAKVVKTITSVTDKGLGETLG